MGFTWDSEGTRPLGDSRKQPPAVFPYPVNPRELVPASGTCGRSGGFGLGPNPGVHRWRFARGEEEINEHDIEGVPRRMGLSTALLGGR